MSLITTISHGNLPSTPRNAYIAGVAFQNYLYDYVQVKNNLGQVVSGSLVSPIPGANASTCPAGRVLQPNGKKLFPGGSAPGVSTYMIGVYDPVTFLSGYIDPNSPYFAPMGTDKSYQIQTFDANGNLVYGVNPNGGAADQGPPVETLGDSTFGANVYIAGNLDISGNTTMSGTLDVTGNSSFAANVDISGALVVDGLVTANTGIDVTSGGIDVTAGGIEVTAGGIQVTAGGVQVTAGGVSVTSGNLVLTNGSIDLNANCVGTASMADPSAFITGGFKKLVVSAGSITATSRVFLTYSSQNNVGILSAEGINSPAGTFTIVSSNTSDLSGVNWMVIN
jgi:hypothetical protein